MSHFNTKTVDDGQRQWQPQAKRGACPWLAFDTDLSTQGLQIAFDHVQTDTTARDIADAGCRRKTGLKQKLEYLLFAQCAILLEHAQGLRLGQYLVAIDAATIVTDLHDNGASIVKRVQGDHPPGRFAGTETVFFCFDAMVGGIAHQMHQWIGQLLHHGFIDIGLRIVDAQDEFLAGLLGELMH